MDHSAISNLVKTSIEANNQTLIASMKELIQDSIVQIKRFNSESTDTQIKEIKKLKYDDSYNFKNKACEDQFKFNMKVQDSIEEAKNSVTANDLQKARDALQKGETFLKQRQKHILLADKSEFGWATVKEYKSNDLADNSEDEKRIRRAEARAKASSKQPQKSKPSSRPLRQARSTNTSIPSQPSSYRSTAKSIPVIET